MKYDIDKVFDITVITWVIISLFLVFSSADTTYFMLFLGIAMVVQFADWGWDLAEGGVPINTVTLLALAIPFFLFLASKTVYVDVAVAGILIALISSFIYISEIKLSRLFYS